MYRSVLALLFTAVLLLSGCAAGQQTVPKEKSGQETNMDGLAFDRSDEEITYMDTKDNVIYLAGGCFWGMEQLMQSIPRRYRRRERLRQRHLRGGRRLQDRLQGRDRLSGDRAGGIRPRAGES